MNAESFYESSLRPRTAQPAPSNPPRVWLLMGDRAGDNSQILALGEALGWPLETKHIVYTAYERIVNLPIFATRAGVVAEESSPLEPPWPDLIISAGRRNEPVARWIQQEAAPDKQVRLVHVGRPWAAIECWDLVVTTPQYRLPDVPNVLQNEAPLHRVTPERMARAADAWRARLAHLPRPYVAVLAGGNSGPYPFDRASGERLGRQVGELAEEGSILLTTSARTPSETVDALEETVREPRFLYRWRPDDEDNPYFAFLGLADKVVVTGDSVSMMAEACATGRPVYLFDTGEGRTSMRRFWENGDPGEDADGHVNGNGQGGWNGIQRAHLKAFVYRQTMKVGPRRWTRDIRIVHRNLVESGRAVWLGEGHPDPSAPPLRDVERAVERVRGLFPR